MVKLNIKGKEWIFILIAGILAVVVIVFPGFIYVDIEQMDGDDIWLYVIGYVIDFDKGVLDPSDSQFMEGGIPIVGGIFSIIIGIIGIIFIISALMTKFTAKQLPFKAFIWLFAGLFLFISPYLLRLGYILSDPSFEGVYGFAYTFDLFSPFVTFGGLFGMMFGMQELKKER